jgi:CRP-like cAMP-binding protein
MMDKNALRNISIFNEMDETEFQLFLSVANKKFFQKGDLVFSEGDSGESIFFINEGKARITKDVPVIGPQTLSILEQGEYFGEMVLLNDAPRYFSVMAETDLSLFEFHKDDFLRLLDEDVEVSYKILWFFCRSLSYSLRRTNERLKNIFSMNAL